MLARGAFRRRRSPFFFGAGPGNSIPPITLKTYSYQAKYPFLWNPYTIFLPSHAPEPEAPPGEAPPGSQLGTKLILDLGPVARVARPAQNADDLVGITAGGESNIMLRGQIHRSMSRTLIAGAHVAEPLPPGFDSRLAFLPLRPLGAFDMSGDRPALELPALRGMGRAPAPVHCEGRATMDRANRWCSTHGPSFKQAPRTLRGSGLISLERKLTLGGGSHPNRQLTPQVGPGLRLLSTRQEHDHQATVEPESSRPAQPAESWT